eukprot:TRINITY_DN933_c0_g1_i1.p1 TRINITY_DN933_c0_g1~~TRINITY_DN933_c0_g1_i1.p1  ORF type:complete len:596 (+),score=97.94 TRINITY_DN933_c0_g1_i1:88-1875(+)
MMSTEHTFESDFLENEIDVNQFLAQDFDEILLQKHDTTLQTHTISLSHTTNNPTTPSSSESDEVTSSPQLPQVFAAYTLENSNFDIQHSFFPSTEANIVLPPMYPNHSSFPTTTNDVPTLYPANSFTESYDSSTQLNLFDLKIKQEEEEDLIIPNRMVSINGKHLNSSILNSTKVASSSPSTCSSSSSSSSSSPSKSPPSKSLKKRPRKKRKLKEVSLPNPLIDTKSVVLPREALLNLNSSSFDDYVRKVGTSREISNEEQKALKRQRRLIKNRESAQASRQRKKDYIDQLEEKVAKLTNDNASIKEHLAALQSENNHLKNEVTYLHDIIKKNPGLSSLFQGMNYLGKISKQGYTNNVRVASVCLMLILFSFGLFFNPHQGNLLLSLPPQRDFIPDSIPASTNGRVLATKFQPASLSHGDVVRSSNQQQQDDEVDIKRLENKNYKKDQKYQSKNQQQKASSSPISPKSTKHELLLEAPSRVVQSPSKHKDDVVSSVDIVTTHHDPKSVSNIQPIITNWKPNTTYLVCPDVRQITPPPEVQVEEANSPHMVAFLIPPDTLNPSNETDSGSMIEVTCQVVDINMLPVFSSLNRMDES